MKVRQLIACGLVLILVACGGGGGSSGSGSGGGSGGGGGGGGGATVASITVTPASASIAVGATQQFTATAKDSSGNTLSGVTFTWTSSSTGVASISSAGLATGVAAGSTNITASASGVTSAAAALTVIAAPAVTTSSLPNGTVGAAYSVTLQASGGTPPYTWSISSGSLPSWATLNASTGAISGTPTAAGTSSFTVQVADSESPAAKATANLSITVNNQTSAGYFIPYTIEMGSSQTDTGLYLVSAANPSLTPITVSTAALDGFYSGFGYATLYSWIYNVSNQQATNLTPALEVYGQGGHLYQISLTDPSAGPQQLSSLTYTTLCFVFENQEGPYGGSAPQYVEAGIDRVAGDNCVTPTDEQTYYILAGTPASTAPQIQLPAGAYVTAQLWDTSTGLVTANLVQNGSELDLDDPNFVKQKALLTGLSANNTYNFGEINGSALIDEGIFNSTSSPETSMDTFYLVNASSATQVASYSTNSASPYFISSACTLQGTGFASFVFGLNAGSQFVYSYPDSSGNLNIYTLPAAGGAPTAIYTAGGVCLFQFDGVGSSNLAMSVTTATSGGDESIALAGPASQTPIPLAGFAANSFVHYVIGNNAWAETNSAPYTVTAVDMATGNVVQTFSGDTIEGDVWGGYDSIQGIDRTSLTLAQISSNPCTATDAGSNSLLATGLEAVDTSNFNVTGLPSGTAFSECVSYFYGTGLVQMGSLAAQTGQYNAAALILGSSLTVDLNLAAPPSGASTTGSPFVNMLVPTSAYF